MEEQLELSMVRFPKFKVVVIAHSQPGMEEHCRNTADLIKHIYQGTTCLKMREAENLRKLLIPDTSGMVY